MSYIRDAERIETGLPDIRKSTTVAWEATPSRITTFEDDRRSAFRSSVRSDHVIYPRPPSPTHRRQTELQEQIRVYKDELAKKERLISQLTSLETPRPRGVDVTVIEDSYSSERIRETATLKSEIAALSVKIDGLQQQNRDQQIQIDMREEKIKEMRIQLETAREGEAKSSAMASSLRQKLVEFEAAQGSMEGAATRSEVAIQTLQKENLNLQERIAELEARLRQHQEDRDKIAGDIRITEGRYAELVAKLSTNLGFEEGLGTVDVVVSKVTDIVQDNALLRGKISSMKEYLTNAELETKASRETIMRLVSEAEREQKHNSRFTLEMENIRTERDRAVSVEGELRREIQVMQERLDSSSRALGVARRELEEKEARYSSIDRDARAHEMAARNVDAQFKAFKETLAAMLSDSFTRVEPFEDVIRDRIQALVNTGRDRTSYCPDMMEPPLTLSRSTSPVHWSADDSGFTGSFPPGSLLPSGVLRPGERSRSRARFAESMNMAIQSRSRSMSPSRHFSPTRMSTDPIYDQNHVDHLERKVAELTAQIESQYDLSRSADIKVRRAEDEMMVIQERLRKAEGELAAGDALRDGMRMDKERYLQFLERISAALGMDPLTADLCLDSIVDAILVRGEQLMKMEHDQLVDRKTHIYNLQRKIKALKEQLESKDLHMDLLRKKVASMEERLVCKSEAEREKDEEHVKNKKLLKLVERYKRELHETRAECSDLKARLLEGVELRNRTMEQEKELEVLEGKVGELERVRQKQAHKIAGLKGTIDESTADFEEKRGQVANTVGALSSELRTTKAALNETTKRERQLLDLRSVVARMLGLNVTNLAVPDYEIISRLEKLILANQANATTAVVLDTALEDMEDGFKAGYADAARAMATRNGVVAAGVPVGVRTAGGSRSGSLSRQHSRTRSRSLSPSRKRDTRAY